MDGVQFPVRQASAAALRGPGRGRHRVLRRFRSGISGRSAILSKLRPVFRLRQACLIRGRVVWV